MSAGILHFLNKEGTVKSQTFTSSGTFTVPNGITTVIVEGQGAGGAGQSTRGADVPGMGGGAGHYGTRFISVTPLSNVSVVVGSGGVGVNEGGLLTTTGIGSNGGSSSFGSVVWRGGEAGGNGLVDASYKNGQGSGNGGNGGLPIEFSVGIGTSSANGKGQAGPHFDGGLPGASPNGDVAGGGGGSGLGQGGAGVVNPTNGANFTGGTGGVGAGGGAANGQGASAVIVGGSGGRGEITVYWIDPT